MAFTIHPNIKPSDEYKYGRNYYGDKETPPLFVGRNVGGASSSSKGMTSGDLSRKPSIHK